MDEDRSATPPESHATDGASGPVAPPLTVSGESFIWADVRPVPEPRSARGRATRQLLIEAAADLFASRGLDGVDVGDILKAAGQRNASAIQYHFGSREGLIIAVLQPRPDLLGPLEVERERQLGALLVSGEQMTLGHAVDILVRPTWLLLATRPGRSMLRVAAQVVRSLPLEHRAAPGGMVTQRTMAMIAARLPDVPEATRRERLGTAFTLYVELLADRAREIEHGLSHHLDDRAYQEEVIAMIVGLLTASVRPQD